jgi:hypothetical protein
MTAVLTVGLADLGWGWRRHWENVESGLAAVLAPGTQVRTGESIRAARDQLFDFYCRILHLEDALMAEAGSIGVSRATVRAAVDHEPDLALAADLCNLGKHVKLTRRTRSGSIPVVTDLQGVGETGGGWHLGLRIEHAGRRRDGLQVAQGAVDAWRRILAGWNLI